MPYTTLVAGTTITSSWANANVRDQVITPFATAAARTSAIGTPQEGMLTYRTDADLFEGYNGTAWVPASSNIVARQLLTSNSSALADNTDSDMTFNIDVRADRSYLVNFHSQISASAASDWQLTFRVDGVGAARVFYETGLGIGDVRTPSTSVLWQPTTGTKTVVIHADRPTGSGTLTLQASATVPRILMISDIGPRLA